MYRHVFAHAKGGVERHYHVKTELDREMGTGTILQTARAGAYSAYVVDNPSLKLCRCWVNHSVANKEGFPWNLYVDAGDGEDVRNPPDGYAAISVSTQEADGMLGKLQSL